MRKKSVGNPNDRSKTSSQTAYQRANQREGSPHYVFLYSDDDSSETEEDIALARVRTNRSPPHKVEVIKIQLKAEDTLQALALRYHCTISELKRINHIHKENEIFARRHIEVPVQPFSIITENLIDYEGAPGSVENGVALTQQPEPSISREEQLINLIATPIVPLKIPGVHNIVSNPSSESTRCNADCELAALTRKLESKDLYAFDTRGLSSTAQHATIDWFKCSGADWGLRWTHLLGVSLFLGFAVPLIYVFYIAERTPSKDAT